MGAPVFLGDDEQFIDLGGDPSEVLRRVPRLPIRYAPMEKRRGSAWREGQDVDNVANGAETDDEDVFHKVQNYELRIKK